MERAKILKFFFLLTILISSDDNFAISNHSEIVYGQDNRADVIDIKNPIIRSHSKAVAGRIDRWSYTHINEENKGPIFFYDPPKLSDPLGANVCKDEKFAEQPVVVDCTGFLVGEDLLVTAGHCMVDEGVTIKDGMSDQCKDFQWLFDFDVNGTQSMDLQNVDPKNVYSCHKIVFAQLNDQNDFALIKINRKVTDRKFLKIRKESQIKKDTPLYVIGHPSGLPKKYAPGAKVIINNEKNFFSTNLDTFGGNSGSPVFNAITHEVEGILVRGKNDYITLPLEGESCLRVNICNNEGLKCTEDDLEIDGEQVSRISLLKDFIN